MIFCDHMVTSFEIDFYLLLTAKCLDTNKREKKKQMRDPNGILKANIHEASLCTQTGLFLKETEAVHVKLANNRPLSCLVLVLLVCYNQLEMG